MLNALKKYWDKTEVVEVPASPLLAQHTGDLWKLEQYKRQLLFITGDHTEQLLAKEASHVGMPIHPMCYTQGEYTLWKKDLGVHSYPVVLPQNYRPSGFVAYPVEPARIRGELWSIRPSQFILLDKHKENGVKFRRERVSIRLPYQEVGWSSSRPLPKISDQLYFYTVEAWMYTGVLDYWDATIGGIFASAQLEAHDHPKWVKKYFQFE